MSECNEMSEYHIIQIFYRDQIITQKYQSPKTSQFHYLT